MIGCRIFPVTVQVSDRLRLGAGADLVYGALTVQQAMQIWAG